VDVLWRTRSRRLPT